MIVRCKVRNQPNISSRLTVGKDYIVLAIEVFNSGSLYAKEIGDTVAYRLEDDDGIIIPYPAKIFEIKNNSLSSSWVAIKREGVFSVLPESWARDGFWEDFYNDVPSAITDFNKIKQVIYSENNNDK